MIDYVVGGEYMNVTSSKGATPYIGHNSNPMQGAVSYESSTGNMKVFDGNGWQVLGGGSACVNLTANAITTLRWAEKKMNEELENERLAETNPTIKSLLEEMNKHKNQIEMVKILMKNEAKV